MENKFDSKIDDSEQEKNRSEKVTLMMKNVVNRLELIIYLSNFEANSEKNSHEEYMRLLGANLAKNLVKGKATHISWFNTSHRLRLISLIASNPIEFDESVEKEILEISEGYVEAKIVIDTVSVDILADEVNESADEVNESADVLANESIKKEDYVDNFEDLGYEIC